MIRNVLGFRTLRKTPQDASGLRADSRHGPTHQNAAKDDPSAFVGHAGSNIFVSKLCQKTLEY